MRKAVIFKSFFLAIVLMLLQVYPLEGVQINYNRGEAIKYASRYCGSKDSGTKYNPDYKCFNPQKPECEKGGTDCANFVSQALIAGGLKFYSCINKSFPIKGAKARCDRAELIKGAVNIQKITHQKCDFYMEKT